MVDESRPIEDILTEYSSSPNRQNAKLADLSHLSREESLIYHDVWVKMETADRRRVINHLIELAEDNVELNFDEIFKACLGDPDARVRRQAIEGLWENEESSLITTLLNILVADPDEDVRAAAASSLGRFILLSEHGKLRMTHVSRIQEHLLSVTHNTGETETVRRRALESLAPLSVSEVRQAIRDAYASRDTGMKVSSLYAMGKNCDTSWLPVLIQELGNEDAEIRYETAGALGAIGEEEAVPYLIKLGNDPDTEVQMAILQALGNIGGRRAKEYLQYSLDAESQAVRDAARQALVELEASEDPLSLQL
jgi:HEAT repeat protein